jgi:mannose-6-phosphate isomerase-like protein (cupin superfamily)
MQVINIQDKLSLFSEHWAPKIIAELNDSHVKLAKIQGEFVWHTHENEDEMFIVISGDLKVELRDKTYTVKSGELIVIPKGVEHRTVAENEVALMLIEPKGTVNTGDAEETGDKKPTEGEWI